MWGESLWEIGCRARHTKQRNQYMDDLALQVSNAVMAASDQQNALTKFIRNIEAWVFADMQCAPL